MPTLSATSEVIGDLLARPRIPSVPKYRRDMEIPLARFCRLGLPFRELDCISYPGRFLLASMVNAGCEPFYGRAPRNHQFVYAHVTRRTLKNRNRPAPRQIRPMPC